MALVMALILLSVMMTSALALGRYILSELRMSLNSVNGISAFYAADSGLEKGLYYLRYGVDQSNLGIFDGLAEAASPFTLANSDATFDYLAATTTSPVPSFSEHTYTVFDISTSSPGTLPGTVNILDPTGNVVNIDWASGGSAYSYKIYWKVNNCFPNHASDRLEVTNVSFASNFTDVREENHILLCDCTYSNDWCNSLVSEFPMSNQRFYRFSFRPLDGAVEELSFDVLRDNVPVGIKSEAIIDVSGSYHNSTYRMQARVPALNVVSGVFSYIIFSEQPIIKNP